MKDASGLVTLESPVSKPPMSSVSFMLTEPGVGLKLVILFLSPDLAAGVLVVCVLEVRSGPMADRSVPNEVSANATEFLSCALFGPPRTDSFALRLL